MMTDRQKDNMRNEKERWRERRERGVEQNDLLKASLSFSWSVYPD